MEHSITSGIENHIFPGAISAVRIGKEAPLIVTKGGTEQGRHSPIDEHTLYDVASLTKIVATLTAVLFSLQKGKLSLTDPIVKHLPEWKAADQHKQGITIYHLLTHTSGFSEWRPYFISLSGREAYLSAIVKEAMLGKPGEQVVYSDIGFVLLGFILERIWDDELDQLTKKLVFQPLGLKNTSYLPFRNGFDSTRIAPTEEDNRCEYQMAKHYVEQREKGLIKEGFALRDEQIDQLNWRKGRIRGTVHDCNAHYGLGGVSGHAGLFSTMHDLLLYMEIWSDPEGKGLLDPVLRDFAIRCHTGQLAPARAIGWEASATGGCALQIINGCSGGDLVSAKAFGHTGFTGTSMWHDPEREMTIITLANRLMPGTDDGMIRWRRMHHNRLFASFSSARLGE